MLISFEQLEKIRRALRKYYLRVDLVKNPAKVLSVKVPFLSIDPPDEEKEFYFVVRYLPIREAAEVQILDKKGKVWFSETDPYVLTVNDLQDFVEGFIDGQFDFCSVYRVVGEYDDEKDVLFLGVLDPYNETLIDTENRVIMNYGSDKELVSIEITKFSEFLKGKDV
jgi:uncharacterized protein YuzE